MGMGRGGGGGRGTYRWQSPKSRPQILTVLSAEPDTRMAPSYEMSRHITGNWGGEAGAGSVVGAGARTGAGAGQGGTWRDRARQGGAGHEIQSMPGRGCNNPLPPPYLVPVQGEEELEAVVEEDLREGEREERGRGEGTGRGGVRVRGPFPLPLSAPLSPCQ